MLDQLCDLIFGRKCLQCGQRGIGDGPVPIHVTRDGAMWIHPSDVLHSVEYKRDVAAIRELFRDTDVKPTP